MMLFGIVEKRIVFELVAMDYAMFSRKIVLNGNVLKSKKKYLGNIVKHDLGDYDDIMLPSGRL